MKMRQPGTTAFARRRGAALIIVLGILTLVALLGITFALVARLDRHQGISYREDVMNEIEVRDFALNLLKTDHLSGTQEAAWSFHDSIDSRNLWFGGEDTAGVTQYSFRAAAGDSGRRAARDHPRPAGWSGGDAGQRPGPGVGARQPGVDLPAAARPERFALHVIPPPNTPR